MFSAILFLTPKGFLPPFIPFLTTDHQHQSLKISSLSKKPSNLAKKPSLVPTESCRMGFISSADETAGLLPSAILMKGEDEIEEIVEREYEEQYSHKAFVANFLEEDSEKPMNGKVCEVIGRDSETGE